MAGTYNAGYNQRACTNCPAGLTTSAANSASPTDCVAPKGYYYLRGKAVACAKGTFKVSDANIDCTACLTTPGWGYFDGSAQQCDYATYSTGYSQVGPQHCHCGQVTCGMRNF